MVWLRIQKYISFLVFFSFYFLNQTNAISQNAQKLVVG